MTPPRYLGQYEVGAELGRGAAGVVFRAQERMTGRAVALKVVSRELAASPGFYERFLREASVASRVAHPNVAALYAAGEQEGALFLALELVPGGSLADQLRARGRLPWDEAATLAAEVARGLGAVHAAGLVHRDVTPANVLLDQEGRAKLADFGLVRRVGASSAAQIGRLTETGEILGTLEYLSPEQANGTGEVGPSADLYGLGATLHALVAGTPPFQGEGVGLVKQHLLAPPPRLAALVPETPLALEALVQRLLEKDATRRGKGALEVAAELEAILGSEASAPEGRRFPLLAGVFALAMGAVGLGAGLAARTPSPPAPSPRPSSAAAPTPTPTPALLRSPPVDRAALEAQLQQDPELRAIAGRIPASSRFKLEGVWGHPAWTNRVPITSGAVAPSGQWFVTGGMDWLVRRWDVEGHLLETLPMLTHGWVMALAVSPDGKTIAASGDRRDTSTGVALFDLETRSKRFLPASPGAADSVAFSRDGARLLTAHDDGTLRVWDVESATELTCIHAHAPRPGLPWQQRYLDAALSPDGHRAISGCIDGTLGVWELSSRQEVARVPLAGAIVRVAWSPADDRALVGLMDGRVAVLDLAGDKPSAPVYVDCASVPWPVFGLAFAPDGLSALVTHMDARAFVLDLAASPVRVAQVMPVGLAGPLPFASFLPDGKRFLVGGDSRSVGLFDVATGMDRRAAGATHRGAVWGLDVSADGRRGVTAGTDAVLKTWDPASGRLVGQIRSDEVTPFFWAGVLPDGRRALTSSMSGEARLWDLERGAPLGPGAPVVPLPPHPGPPGPGFRPAVPLRLALFPDGQRFLAALPNGGIELWGVEALVRLATLRAGSPDAVPVAAVAISSDGARAITGSEGGELLLWDLVQKESRSLQSRSQPPVLARDKHVSAAFVPGTTTALVGQCDSSVTLWDVVAGQPLRRFVPVSQSNSVVQAVVVGPGARRFVSACEDGTVRLWDLASGAELDRIDLEPSGDVPQRLALMDGGRSLLVGTARGVVYRFLVTWGEP